MFICIFIRINVVVPTLTVTGIIDYTCMYIYVNLFLHMYQCMERNKKMYLYIRIDTHLHK
jgi:hypothetical protein